MKNDQQQPNDSSPAPTKQGETKAPKSLGKIVFSHVCGTCKRTYEGLPAITPEGLVAHCPYCNHLPDEFYEKPESDAD